MSLNDAHGPQKDSVILYQGELLIIFYQGVKLKFSENNHPLFKDSKSGSVYLTTHRVIFRSDHQDVKVLCSMSIPFNNLREVDIDQPVLGANAVTGKVLASPQGGFNGYVKFRMTFNKGGAYEFAMDLRRTVKLTGIVYTPPVAIVNPTNYYPAPPPAYTAPAQTFGWVNPMFNQHPAQNTMYQYPAPPPYQGVALGTPVGPTQVDGYGNPIQPQHQLPQNGFYQASAPQQMYSDAPPAYTPPYPQQNGMDKKYN